MYKYLRRDTYKPKFEIVKWASRDIPIDKTSLIDKESVGSPLLGSTLIRIKFQLEDWHSVKSVTPLPSFVLSRQKLNPPSFDGMGDWRNINLRLTDLNTSTLEMLLKCLYLAPLSFPRTYQFNKEANLTSLSKHKNIVSWLIYGCSRKQNVRI